MIKTSNLILIYYLFPCFQVFLFTCFVKIVPDVAIKHKDTIEFISNVLIEYQYEYSNYVCMNMLIPFLLFCSEFMCVIFIRKCCLRTEPAKNVTDNILYPQNCNCTITHS